MNANPNLTVSGGALESILRWTAQIWGIASTLLIRTLCFSFLLTGSGCGTMAAHVGDCGSRSHGVYMGTVFDAGCIAAPFLSDPPMFLPVPVGVADLPFSFAADTIFFPFDLVDYIDYTKGGSVSQHQSDFAIDWSMNWQRGR